MECTPGRRAYAGSSATAPRTPRRRAAAEPKIALKLPSQSTGRDSRCSCIGPFPLFSGGPQAGLPKNHQGGGEMLVGLQRDGRQRQSVGRSQAKIKRWRGSLSRCTLGWQIESSIKEGKKKGKIEPPSAG